MNKKEERTINLAILITVLISAAFLTRAIIISSKAIFDSLLVMLLLFLMHRYKKNLDISAATAFGAALFFTLHLIGAHGMYDYYLFDSVGYDKLLHFYGPFVLFVVIFNYLNNYLRTKKVSAELTHIIFFAMLITWGINALQEVLEFTGNSLLGSGEGVFFYGSGDIGGNDTPKDLIANFLGACLSGIIMFFRKKKNVR